jgi:hypothetical protein
VYLLVGVNHASSDHGAEAGSQATDGHDPGVRHHDAVDKAALDHLARRQADDADAQTRVHEGLVEVGALEQGHAAVLTRLAVEHDVHGDQGAAKDGTAREQAAAHRGRVGGLLLGARLVGAASALLVEGIAGGADEGRAGGGPRREEARLGRRLMECASGRAAAGASEGRLGQLGRQAGGSLTDCDGKEHRGLVSIESDAAVRRLGV